MSDRYIARGHLQVRQSLVNFIEQEALTGLGLDIEQFWDGFSSLIAKYMEQNRALLRERERLQHQIDDWHQNNGPITTTNTENYLNFLKEIGYLVAEPGDVSIATTGLDPEITTISGPQLVVPINNARYALNAANARWGSLYDAFYGTDILPQTGSLRLEKRYNPVRGAAVFDAVADFMDRVFPLVEGSHRNVTAYELKHEQDQVKFIIKVQRQKNGQENVQENVQETRLKDESAFKAWRDIENGQHIVLEHHHLHIILVIQHSHPIGKTHPAGLADIVMESAVTVIQDCEDSVAAVDAEDKVQVYRNWLGLMQATLTDTFEKNGEMLLRKLNQDKLYSSPLKKSVILKGRALMLVRNVGHLMMSDAILDAQGEPIGEGLMDAVVTTVCAMHDLQKKQNSKTGAIYIVKPKMHSPEEVILAINIFSDLEKMLNLAPETIKIGIMDEERRASANLKAIIAAAYNRVFFINTGFLDRTGDEIHTSFYAGPVLPKEAIKAEKWLAAYEDRNMTIGLQCGFMGRAQIGKGMWAKPDAMSAMLEQKIAQINAGANCAWVPSPTAATIHALHYHYVDVAKAQEQRMGEKVPSLSLLFSMPIADKSHLSATDIQEELDNNAQGILGYVVRWVDQNIGCSKVPDIYDVALMEDRATCRISSQLIANWLKHQIVSEEDVRASFERMSVIVDKQNKDDPLYRPMAPDRDNSFAYQAALDLVLKGAESPSGYTEPLLHQARKKVKQQK